MRLQNPFATVSTTGLDSQVLTVLARTEQYLSVHQIHQLLPEEGSPQGVRKSVARLVEQGTVLERVTGRSYAYSLNLDHLLATVILQIANVKSTLLSRMTQVISEWRIQPLTVKIFGSAARNEMRTDSDIDLFIVMPDSATEDAVEDLVGRLAAQTTLWTGNDVRPLVYRMAEVQPASIFTSVLEDGIDIAGDPAWLRKQLRRDKARA
ncbi:putative nucleotidyltransferase [Psychromicrobium silvestre]|uniref:Putative nucleotidyltransferase n=1 Tax=Psychromicrobium silvestre TaxID=1645614 RepID=A0A7Y9LT23_9MICC|nr:nucleotidyltransferase domain-containing protein [Psychromicrobium silvestre]NYE95095.1 putative nucleotidyltransferase [Psychromicrobium silvestre]